MRYDPKQMRNLYCDQIRMYLLRLLKWDQKTTDAWIQENLSTMFADEPNWDDHDPPSARVLRLFIPYNRFAGLQADHMLAELYGQLEIAFDDRFDWPETEMHFQSLSDRLNAVFEMYGYSWRDLETRPLFS